MKLEETSDYAKLHDNTRKWQLNSTEKKVHKRSSNIKFLASA